MGWRSDHDGGGGGGVYRAVGGAALGVGQCGG